MILKMSAVTVLYVLLTAIIWERTRTREIRRWAQILIGIIYGLCSVLSTHFAIDYGDMLLNVRDIGPLAAGLFFHPLSGVIAGLIGGIERFIAGTYWGIGSYTRIACSVSTCLAGFTALFMRRHIFKQRRPDPLEAFFMGAVMEVFHMYVVLITHRGDMNMAYYVVRNCAGPMITFTGLGLAFSSAELMIREGEWKNPFRPVPKEQTRLERRFQIWLFLGISAIFTLNLIFAFIIQSEAAAQNAAATLSEDASDIRNTYEKIIDTQNGIREVAKNRTAKAAAYIAGAVKSAGGIDQLGPEFAEEMRSLYELSAVSVFLPDGTTVLSSGDPELTEYLFTETENPGSESAVLDLGNDLIAAASRNEDGIFQAVFSASKLTAALKLSGLNEAASDLKVGREGFFVIIDRDGNILAGNLTGEVFTENERETLLSGPENKAFAADIFELRHLCRKEKLSSGDYLIAILPAREIYAERGTAVMETIFADILLINVIYVLITLLVQRTVADDLDLVNESLNRITEGDLDEIVNVRNSAEFAVLSDDINQTVTVLKGYIEAAEKRMEEELILARTIQDSALPHNFTFPRSEFELFALMDPAREVGGDFYDFFFTDTDKVALVIADVSGKGIPAALFMMRSKTAIRSLAESGLSPAGVLTKANEALCEGNDGEMFVTAWIGIIDLKTGVMTCANAGHEYPILMRAGGEYEVLKDKHTLALAAMPGISAKEYEIRMKPGDRLFVYSDGVPEAINEAVEDYGIDRLTARLNTLREADMKETLITVRKDLSDFTGKAEQFDDITMLNFLYKGAEAPERLNSGKSAEDQSGRG